MDVDSRLPATGLVSSGTYRSNELGNWAHEATHGVNSLIRLQYGNRYNAMYLTGGWAAVIAEPPFRLSQAGQYVPASLRADMFTQHLLSSSWQDKPLYALDEWACYQVSAQAQIELAERGMSPEGGASAMRYCLEAAFNSLAVLIQASQSPYDATQLRLAVGFFWERMMSTWAKLAAFPQALQNDPAGYYARFTQGSGPGVPELRRWVQATFGDQARTAFRLG